MHGFINRFLLDLKVLPTKPVSRQQRTDSVRVRQKAPPAGHAKIHVDSGVARSKTSGAVVVVVCRDNAGNFLGSSALVINGVTNAAALEAMSCRDPLALSEDLHLHSFIVASDAKQAISNTTIGTDGLHGLIIAVIRTLSVGFNCTFLNESRVANYEADRLARFSHSLNHGLHLWLLEPHD